MGILVNFAPPTWEQTFGYQIPQRKVGETFHPIFFLLTPYTDFAICYPAASGRIFLGHSFMTMLTSSVMENGETPVSVREHKCKLWWPSCYVTTHGIFMIFDFVQSVVNAWRFGAKWSVSKSGVIFYVVVHITGSTKELFWKQKCLICGWSISFVASS